MYKDWFSDCKSKDEIYRQKAGMYEAQLKVYRSSAGSGKTFTLVKEYLALCFREGRPDYFRHILAITFTVKAAREMKERVFLHLQEFSTGGLSGKSQAMLAALCQEHGFDEAAVLQKSGKIFHSMMHRYGDVAVMTIDRFVHRIIRSFAYELELSHDFQIELDVDRVIRETVETLFGSVGEDPHITRLLLDFIVQKSEEDKSWKVDNELRGLLKQMLTEEFQLNTKGGSLKPTSELYEAIKKLDAERKAFEGVLKKIGQEGMDLVREAGIDPASFAGGAKGGICKFLEYLIDSNFEKFRPTPSLQEKIGNGKWHASKVEPWQKDAIDGIRGRLEALFHQACGHVERDFERQSILRLIRHTIYAYGTAAELKSILDTIKESENILLISEFNEKIARVTLSEAIPFIYERIGNRYRHFLIDEFQDTSSLQWQNILPLVENGLSLGHASLIVGDAKQSIYRFRGSEPEQLIRLPEPIASMSSPHTIERLENIKRYYNPYELLANYRSAKTIVDFNNRFFEGLSGSMLSESYAHVYRQLAQQPFSVEDGYVSFRFFDAPNQEQLSELYFAETMHVIQSCLGRGHSLKDIAILCRANTTASMLASHLIEAGIPVISQESLLLMHVPEVKLLISTLRFFRFSPDVFNASQILFGLAHCGFLSSDALTAECLRLKAEEDNYRFDGLFPLLEVHMDTAMIASQSMYAAFSGLMDAFRFRSDDPFLLKLLDFAFEYDENPQLIGTSFIEHWDGECEDLSIELQEGQDAVQVMTIHKSKGLEFPIVIYPGINIHQKPTREQTWANVEHYFPEIPHTLLPLQKSLEGTSLEGLYTEEMAKSKMDQLNIIYVACTRAVSELYVFGKAKDGRPHCKELDFLADWEEWTDNSLKIGTETSVEKSGKTVKESSMISLVGGN